MVLAVDVAVGWLAYRWLRSGYRLKT
jgi:hypothetical protein